LDQQRQLETQLEAANRAPRRVRLQALVREINVQIARLQLQAPHRAHAALIGLLCECGDADCIAEIQISPAAFDAARLGPTTFLVSPGHELRDGTETVLERDADYAVIRKKTR
jgi:hypothetical protein